MVLFPLVLSSVAAFDRLQVSGIYPHLAVSNSSMECGIGAVVPWAGSLWFLTYPPHAPEGSDDKLYTLDADLTRRMHPMSVGGTHANRFIHEESGQLIIGPYFTDRDGNVRVVEPARMPGRLTATMRHLTDPANLVYMLGMEEELYEVNVHSLEVRRLYRADGIPMPGTHAKGGRTAQGHLVYSNNGDHGWEKGLGSGSLVQWDGSTWLLVERAQFTEVTGPDGLLGGRDPSDVLWALGWDKRSVILKLLESGVWHTFRLPKGSYTHDAAHGWYTEWPRIREVTDGVLLCHMHGLFYQFPRDFRLGRTGGIVPLSTYHKMPVDYCGWNGRIVMGCNDASRFDNPFVTQPDSNLWFGTLDDIRGFGAPAGWGGPWVDDAVAPGRASDPFLIGGFRHRVVHIRHGAHRPVTFTLEVDREGTGAWARHDSVEVPAKGYVFRVLPDDLHAVWMRLVPDHSAENVTAYLHLSNPYVEDAPQGSRPVPLSFEALADVDQEDGVIGGIVRPRGGDRRVAQFLAEVSRPDGEAAEVGYYEVGDGMKLARSEDAEGETSLHRIALLGEPDFGVDAASVVMRTPNGRVFRLPKTDERYDRPFAFGWPRGIREVVTERSLMNIHGTFYELPRESSGGLARIRPICTHGRQIIDFCSWHGMLVLAGTRVGARPDGHFVPSEDGLAGLWFGNVDDLWHLGKPRGFGGPWRNRAVKPGQPSDPYLMAGYDGKKVELSHDSHRDVEITIEVDFLADGSYAEYRRIVVPPGKTVVHRFPDGFSAHWVRFRPNRACRATAILAYT